MRWKNTGYGGVWNIVIEEGLVAFVATYYKGYRSSGNIKRGQKGQLINHLTYIISNRID
jgi:hypothetical protein